MLAIIVKVIHLIVCFGLIVIVLFQADKGEGLAGAFGGGASSTVFGERGSGGFLSKLTTSLAIVFMITSLVISIKGADWDKEAAMENFNPNTVQTATMPSVPMGMPMGAPIAVTSEAEPIAVAFDEPVVAPLSETPAPDETPATELKSVSAPPPVAPVRFEEPTTATAVVEEKKADVNEAAPAAVEEKKDEVTDKVDIVIEENSTQAAE